ncbi:hypothetical protein ACMFMG_009483 [Clarireedia jacksonii]
MNPLEIGRLINIATGFRYRKIMRVSKFHVIETVGVVTDVLQGEDSRYQLYAGRNQQGPVGLPIPQRPHTRHSSRKTPAPEDRSRQPPRLTNNAIQYDLQRRPATANSHRAERPALIRATTGSYHGSRTPSVASVQQSSQELRRRSSPADYRRYELEQKKSSQPRPRPLSLYAVPDPPQIQFHKYLPKPDSMNHYNDKSTPPMALSSSMDAGRHYFRDQEPEVRSHRVSQNQSKFSQSLRMDWWAEASAKRDFDMERDDDTDSISSIDPMVPDCQLENPGPPRWI